jgi:transposase-like protein
MTHFAGKELRVAKRRYTKEFREFAVERLRGCENIVALARELQVSRRQLYRWRDELDPEIPGMEAPGQEARASTLRKEANHLKRILAEKTLEVDFFRSAFQKVEARRQQSSRTREKASTSKSGR